MVQAAKGEKLEHVGERNEHAALSPSIEHDLCEIVDGKSQNEGNDTFKTDFKNALEGTDEKAIAVFKGKNKLNEYNSAERKEARHDLVAGFNKLDYEGKERVEAAEELAEALYQPVFVSLDQAEAQFNLDPNIVAAARDAGVKDVSYNGGNQGDDPGEIFMVVENMAAAEKFQEQSGNAARIVSAEGWMK